MQQHLKLRYVITFAQSLFTMAVDLYKLFRKLDEPQLKYMLDLFF